MSHVAKARSPAGKGLGPWTVGEVHQPQLPLYSSAGGVPPPPATVPMVLCRAVHPSAGLSDLWASCAI